MNLHIRVKYLKDLKDNDPFIKRAISYHSDEQFVDVHADKFTLKQLDALYERASKDGKEVSGARGLCQKITAYRNVRADPSGQKIGKLEPFAVALRAYIEPSPNKWLFSDESDGFAIPYFVGHIAYSKADPTRGRQACVDVRLEAVTRGGSDGKSLSISMTDLGK